MIRVLEFVTANGRVDRAAFIELDNRNSTQSLRSAPRFPGGDVFADQFTKLRSRANTRRGEEPSSGDIARPDLESNDSH